MATNPPAPTDEARRREEDFNRNRRIIIVGPGWSPYSWWMGGTSYWWPPYDSSYGGYNDSSTAQNTTPTPDTPTPTAEQAKALNTLEGMPDYSRAMVELKMAQSVYDTASKRALEKLKNNPEYQVLVKERDAAANEVEAVQASAKIPPPAEVVTPAAKKKMDISAKITRMEQDAINADPQAFAAKMKLVEVNERLAAMRKASQGTGVR